MRTEGPQGYGYGLYLLYINLSIVYQFIYQFYQLCIKYQLFLSSEVSEYAHFYSDFVPLHKRWRILLSLSRETSCLQITLSSLLLLGECTSWSCSWEVICFQDSLVPYLSSRHLDLYYSLSSPLPLESTVD